MEVYKKEGMLELMKLGKEQKLTDWWDCKLPKDEGEDSTKLDCVKRKKCMGMEMI